MTIGSLFSGIGGLELGLERAGLGPVAWQCERDPFCRSVLDRHWPGVARVPDVREMSPALGLAQADLICGGFPCQDVSVAGKGAGLAGARSGLWSEFARVVDEFQPAIVVVENVSRGWERWGPRVCTDLEELGYSPCPVVLSAGRVGAPHERSRAFVVADTDGQFVRLVEQRGSGGRTRGVRDAGEAEPVGDGIARRAPAASPWTAAPRVGRVGDGVSAWVDGSAEHRDARLRAIGNAVVPAVAEVIGRMIAASLGAVAA